MIIYVKKSFYGQTDRRKTQNYSWEPHKTCIFASFQAIINMFIREIFPNIITYLDKSFKEKQNYINFKMK